MSADKEVEGVKFKSEMKRIIYLILFCSLCIPIFRDSAFPAETGAAFLKIGVGARPLGMGGGYIAIADDVNAIYWNPGGLAQLKQKEITAMHNEWIDDLKYEFVGYAHPLTRIDTNKIHELARIKNLGTLAFGIAYLRMGEMEKRGENREKLNETFTAYDFAGTISYSRVIKGVSGEQGAVSVGVNLKFIQQKIEEETANGFALDLGVLQKTGIKNLNLGLAIQNLGPKMKFIKEGYNLPLSISFGLAYKILGICNFGDPAKAVIGINVTYGIFEKRTEFGFGTEYWLLNTIALRGRYNIANSNELSTHRKCGVSDNNQLTKEVITSFGFGLGLKLTKVITSEVITSYQIDYSFLPYADLGNTHRLSFTARF